jgi:tetraacyldisaccharide 4'-kinase
VYDAITRFRNHLYNIGYKRSFRFEIPVIGVGNLIVGGSGKTPMIEYLIRRLMSENRISILSRGYGRVTRGLRFAKDNETARTLGDEPLQFFRAFKDKVNVVVCEDRAFAIPNILQEFPQTTVILMDDSFQHRSVNPQLNILLTEYNSPFHKDYVMPFGKLREARVGSGRADVIVVTKCHFGISNSEIEEMTTAMQRIAGRKPVFFTTIQYGSPISFGNASHPLPDDAILVSGIANSRIFEEYARRHHNVRRHFAFKDHHRYSREEVQRIKEYAIGFGKPVCILTTEKDMVRLIDPEFSELIKSLSWFYLPIETVFLKGGSDFDELVTRALKGEGSSAFPNK